MPFNALALLLPLSLLAPFTSPSSILANSPGQRAELESTTLFQEDPAPLALPELTKEQRLLLALRGTIDPQALAYALEARQCAIRAGLVEEGGNRLTVIDYSLPSSEKRLWIIDLESERVIFSDQVAHGAGSGGLVPTRFSNTPNSHMSSLGLIEPLFEFQASSGRALRLRGLEPGINDNIYDREIIVHPSTYIGNGRTGRSQGCQAVHYDNIDVVINGMKGGLLYAYHQDHSQALSSKLIGCGAVLQPQDMICKAQQPETPFRPLAPVAWNLPNSVLDTPLPRAYLATR